MGKKSVGFYIKAAKSFFTGVEKSKDGTAKEAVSSLIISGLGDAIIVAVSSAAAIEKAGLGIVKSIETHGCARIAITLHTAAKPLTAEERQGLMKNVRAEGGKKGVDLDGASHMGNTQFFVTTVDCPRGDMELLVESVKAMNAPAPKTQRAHMSATGGSGHLAKMTFAANMEQVVCVAYVPKDLHDKLKPLPWIQEVMDWYGGEVVDKGEEQCTGIISHLGGNGMGYEILARHKGTDILQRHKLMAEDAHHHDDEIFGDDDLPGLSEEKKKSIFAKRGTIRASIVG